jgi:hypothetical protein
MVMREILQYLMSHPDAKDTILGILRWWLPTNCRGWTVEQVQDALDTLVARGWLTIRRTTPAQQLYGLNKEKLMEIHAFMAAHGDARQSPG